MKSLSFVLSAAALLMMLMMLVCPSAFAQSDTCPKAKPVSFSTSCSIDSSTTCYYDPDACPGSDEIVFTRRCICDAGIGAFVCVSVLLECPPVEEEDQEEPTCPSDRPDYNSPCDGALSCRYTPFACLTSNDITFLDKCDCVQESVDDPSFFFACSKEFILCRPETIALCPASPPFSEKCDSAQAGTVCNYDPFGCPGSTDDAIFLTSCECVTGNFQCTQARRPQCDKPATTVEPPPVPVFCFSGESLVDVQGIDAPIPMKNLRIGDMVRVSSGRTNHHAGEGFEPVYSFGHYSPDIVGDFLEVRVIDDDTTSARTPLQISPDHMLSVKSRGGFIPASALKVGDKIKNGGSGGDDTELIVSSIRAVRALGVFAPFTPSGTIVVNGIVSSSFVSMDSSAEKSSILRRIGGVEVSHQWIAHSFEFPHRVACHYMGQCPNEMYDDRGISTWVSAPHKVGQWLMEEEGHSVLKAMLLLLLAAVAFAFAVLETFVLNANVAMILVVVVFKFMSHRGKTVKSKGL